MNTTTAVAASVVQVDWTAIAAIVITLILSFIAGVFTITRVITKAFHAVDKRIHGVEVIVGPYAKRFDDLNRTIADHADRLSKAEATIEARSSVMDRHERMLENLSGR